MARHSAPARRSAVARPALAAVVCAVLGLGVWGLVTTSDAAAPAAEAVAVLPAAAPPAAAPAPGPAPAAVVTPDEQARCGVTSGACVDLAAGRAWLVDDGAVVRGPVPMAPGTDTGRVAPGRDSSATPTGTFHVQRKDADAVSGKYGDAMPHAVYFAPYGVAFHEGSLTEGSHGCIHLSAADAAAWYDELGIGDAVTVF